MSHSASDCGALTVDEIAGLRALQARNEVVDLFERYIACIDGDRLEEWPEFFTEECSYRIMARENYDDNLPLAIVRCESRGMLCDRVVAIRETMTYKPRHVRHFLTAIGVSATETHLTRDVSANYAVIQSKLGEFSTVHCAGRYTGSVTRESDGILRFKSLDCVFDNGLVANSIVHPF